MINIFWFRRDLRLEDNTGLYHALKSNKNVIPLFIFDTEILNKIEDRTDARVTFIYDEIVRIKKELKSIGSDIIIKIGKPSEVWDDLFTEFQINSIYSNRDYEPYGIKRDQEIKDKIESVGGHFETFKDHVIFEKGEILKDDGSPYSVFTPFKRKWIAKIHENDQEHLLKEYEPSKYFDSLQKGIEFETPTLESLGFARSNLFIPSRSVSQKLIKDYDKNRDFPGVQGTSRLGIHYRFGTISIREKVRKALKLNDTYLNELIWRDFYTMILAEHPRVVNQSYKIKYDKIDWRNNEEEFEKWCMGKTGYKIVDAGMRELNNTGYMHNRVRMITASFLTKHLLIDWRWGEAYFASKLLDFELSSNNGGWQWAAGCGTDAAPYFRIFSPYAQLKKFDKNLEYVSKWVPEHHSDEYAQEIVDHKFARERCLAIYKRALVEN
jgi:deoxyribodipyrimidine photo-lyase